MKKLLKPALAFTLTICGVRICAQEPSKVAPQDAPETKQAEGAPKVQGNLEVLSDTQGVDFGPYLSRVLQGVRMTWFPLVPAEARPPELRSGSVAIEFAIMPSGKVAGMRLKEASGSVPLDRAAWGAIAASDPFAPLPKAFTGPYLALRLHFYYNPKQPPQNPASSQASPQ